MFRVNNMNDFIKTTWMTSFWRGFLLILKIFDSFFYGFYCWIWTSKWSWEVSLTVNKCMTRFNDKYTRAMSLDLALLLFIIISERLLLHWILFEAYLEPCQTRVKAAYYFAKYSFIDVWQVPKYTSLSCVLLLT